MNDDMQDHKQDRMKDDIDIEALLFVGAEAERRRFVDRQFVADVERQLSGYRHVSRLLPGAAFLFACLLVWPLLPDASKGLAQSRFLADALIEMTLGLQEASVWFGGSWHAAFEGGLTLGLAALATVFATWAFASD